MIVSGACIGLAESAAEFYPYAHWQLCTAHFYRNVFGHVPPLNMRKVASMLKARPTRRRSITASSAVHGTAAAI